jgi:diketogulonate reductase-like aldo/keto reductase
MDQVDLLLVHWPHPDIPVKDYMPLMQQAKDANFTKHIGVSNFTPAQMREAIRITPGIITNQVEYHTYLSQEAVLQACRENDMFLTAYSPIAQGKVPKDDRLQKIGQQYGKTAAQVGLRWLVQQGDVVIIPRTSNPDRLEENRDIFDFELSAEEMEELHRLSRQRDRIISPSFVKSWDV